MFKALKTIKSIEIKKILIYVSQVLLSVAPVAAFGVGSGWVFGEPKLPKELRDSK